MNKVFFSVLVLSVVFACKPKHDKSLDTDLLNTTTVNGVVDTNQGPKIMFTESAEIDLGEGIEDAQFKHTFRFKNTGDKNLILTAVQPQCGCTSTDYSKEPIEPGKEGYINIVFDSKGKGPHSGEKSVMVHKAVTVTSNSVINNPFDLKFQVKVFAKEEVKK